MKSGFKYFLNFTYKASQDAVKEFFSPIVFMWCWFKK